MKHVLQAFASDNSGRFVLELELTLEQVAAIRRYAPASPSDPDGARVYHLNRRIAFYVGAYDPVVGKRP